MSEPYRAIMGLIQREMVILAVQRGMVRREDINVDALIMGISPLTIEQERNLFAIARAKVMRECMDKLRSSFRDLSWPPKKPGEW